ncbi:hypothetical protein [Streptomyces sp. Z26]|uniref:hypothetical protein n=1 Tax=Streptomyces sp. Z26 TaxID=2500177 RepID=UPI001F0C1020|nr:hypothetical protein [Streptomyces sp. Z26]
MERAHAEYRLKVLRGEDREADHQEHRHDVRAERGPEARSAEQREIDHGVRGRTLPTQEGRGDGEGEYGGEFLDPVVRRQDRGEGEQ